MAKIGCLVILSIAVAVCSAKKFIPTPVTCADKQLIVDFHNELRAKVASGSISGQPGASNMEKLVWDEELARAAQKWANKKVWAHSTKRKDSRFDVGENLFKMTSKGPSEPYDWKRAIQGWFNEHLAYTYQPIIYDKKTLHYTQVIWADTTFVGCGAVEYDSEKGPVKQFVCQYGPTGNFMDELPYTSGTEACEGLCCTDRDCSLMYGTTCNL